MEIVQCMQKYDVQEKCGKHAGSYMTRFACKYSAIAKAKQELGPHVLDKKQKNQQRLKRYTKKVLIDMFPTWKNTLKSWRSRCTSFV